MKTSIISFKSLKDCRSLQSIRLTFDGCRDFIVPRLETLTKGLKKLSSLQQINIRFYWCSINDDGLISLCQGLKGLVLLKFVRLHFFLCEHITNFGIFEARKCLARSLGKISL